MAVGAAAGLILSACTKDHPRIAREPREAVVELTTLDDAKRERARNCAVCSYFGMSCLIDNPEGSGRPCCEPITRVQWEEDPTLAAACRESWIAREEVVRREGPCKTCLAVEHGRSCMRLNAPGKADIRPCCETIPTEIPMCEEHF